MTSIKRSIAVVCTTLVCLIAYPFNLMAQAINVQSSKHPTQNSRTFYPVCMKPEAKKTVVDTDSDSDYSAILKNAHGEAKEFLQQAIPLALDIQRRYGIPSSAILSMGCFESAYGQSQLSRSAHNYFGIKALRDWNGDVKWSSTLDRGCRHQQPFRRYESMAASFEDYAKFLKSQDRYAEAFKTSSGREFVRRVLAGGYCPDRFYMGFISGIMARYNLTKLDQTVAMD